MNWLVTTKFLKNLLRLFSWKTYSGYLPEKQWQSPALGAKQLSISHDLQWGYRNRGRLDKTSQSEGSKSTIKLGKDTALTNQIEVFPS